MYTLFLKTSQHDDVIKWKHFPRNWPFVREIHRSPVNSPHKGQWRGALIFSLICVWINGWVNNREAGDLRRYRAHSDVIVMRSACKRSTWHVMTWTRFPHYWTFLMEIHRWQFGSSHKGPVMQSFDVFFAVSYRASCWTNNLLSTDLERHAANVMSMKKIYVNQTSYKIINVIYQGTVLVTSIPLSTTMRNKYDVCQSGVI